MKTEDQMQEAIYVIVEHFKEKAFSLDEAQQVLYRAMDLVGYIHRGRQRRPYRRQKADHGATEGE